MSFFNSTAGTNTHTHTQSVTKSVSQGLACFLRPDKVKTSAQNSDKAPTAGRTSGKRETDVMMERMMVGERN